MYKKRKKQNKKVSNKIKIIFYLFIFAALLLFAFFIAVIVYNYTNSKLETKDNKIKNNVTDNDNIIIQKEDSEEILGVIKDISYSIKNIEVLNIKDNTKATFFVDNNTILKDKYNKIKHFSDFTLGDIVNIKYLKNNNNILKLSISKKSWEMESVKIFDIDKKNKIIKIDKDFLKYNEDTKVECKNINCDINLLNEGTIVNLKGIDDTIFYINILKNIGKLKIINFSDIEKGILEIGNKNIISLDDFKNIDEDINITEGSYKVILKGKNIELYTKDIDIISGQLTILDLKDMMYNSSNLTIYLNVPEAKVTINDKIIDISKIQNLPYGEHTIKVESEGFIPYENKIIINKPTEKLNIVLEEEVKSKYIDIITIPEDAQIFIDNEYIGKSPLKISLDFGKKNIIVKKQGYLDVNFPCEINKNTDKYSITLIPNEN